MKKVTLIAFFLLSALSTDIKGLSDGSFEIDAVKKDIERKSFSEANVEQVAQLLTNYSTLTPGMKELAAFITNLSYLIKDTEASYLTRCEYYDTILKVLKELLIENSQPMTILLKAWDIKPNFSTKPRVVYLDLYETASKLYLKLNLLKEYLQEKDISQRKTKINALYDQINKLSFQNPASAELKELPKELTDYLTALENALETLVDINSNFIEEYCALEREYEKKDWQTPDKGAEFRVFLEDKDKDTPWGEFWEESGDEAPEVIIMKTFISKKIQPLYGDNLGETSTNVQSWVGQGKDLLSKINREIWAYKGTPYKDADRVKFSQQQKEALKNNFKEKIKSLAQNAIIDLSQTYVQDKQKIMNEINALDLLDANEKQELINLMLDLEMIKTANKLLPEISQANRDNPTDFLNKELRDAKEAAQQATELAGAKKLKTMQATDLEKAISIFNLQVPAALPNDPSPQEPEYKQIVKTYADAANQLDNVKDLPPNAIKNNMLFPQLKNAIDTLKNSDKLNQLINWVTPEKSVIEAFDAALAEPEPEPEPIDPQELLTNLNTLSISLTALERQTQ